MTALSEKAELITQNLHLTKKQFLCAVPVKTIHWQTDVLHELYSGNNSLLAQKCVMDNTVYHPLVKKFPLKLSYQLTFLKDIINKLESSGHEVLDDLYTTYCNLLVSSSSDSDTSYRHFLLSACRTGCITLKESTSLISKGTTGLCSWQAARALADWCLLHASSLRGCCVLELGSGTGLTGLAVSLCCEPRRYWFSDCHPAVLDLLQGNIRLNTELHCSIPDPQPPIMLTTRCGDNTEIGLLCLPWDDIPSSDIVDRLSPDIVLAADVVYDASCLPGLCRALRHLLHGRHCEAFVACTVRNRNTQDAFLELLGTERLKVITEGLPPPTNFPCTTEAPIVLYRISAGSV
ncbi:protein-lysine N-methyltransferase EEF2KMT isoform X2 [Periplaneta americana]|uniref:protein-lysine N-methyltransferase EEF2KMT isoform X2 n=1 Tax=Periplaneta americana TaxID=6978 RepID=UPI0037E8AF7E